MAGTLQMKPQQQAAFDTALAAMRELESLELPNNPLGSGDLSLDAGYSGDRATNGKSAAGISAKPDLCPAA